MNYVDVSEFAELSGKTESYIRRLCRQNKVPFIQEQVPQSGKLKYLIDIESEDAKKYLHQKDDIPVHSPDYLPQQEPQQNLTNTDVIEILEKFESYILKAGKYELLEDKSKELKQDALHWQEKYFELKYRNETLERENQELRNKLEAEQKRPFWKKSII